MKAVSISGSVRQNVGKKDAKAMRKQGLVPGVLYGGEQQIPFLVKEMDMNALIYTPEVKYAELNLEGKTYPATIQELQFHPVTGKLLHVDLLEAVPTRPVTIAIPVKIVGTAPGVLRGGKLAKKARKLKVRGALENIPECVTVDISNMDILDTIRAGQIQIDNVEVVDVPSTIIVAVLSSRNVTETATEEETAAATE
ncbi:MAG: 50S ribosomal protein L25 [Bacteroidales bacterium]|nr:50S ribosomal protein L25 [Bacteroidales bacterium]MBR4512333.1 50S ribosomal protein L25 [Bacteroidales bacterium]